MHLAIRRTILQFPNRHPLQCLHYFYSTESKESSQQPGPLDQFLSQKDPFLLDLNCSALPKHHDPQPTNFAEQLQYQRQQIISESLDFNNSTFVPPPSAHQLRPYQEQCISASLDALLSHNIRRQAVSLPVGAGKTVVFSHLLQRAPIPKPGATKVLVLAHRRELLDQAKTQIQRAAPHLKIVIDGAGYTEPKELSEYDVVVASVLALGNCNYKRLSKYNPDDFKMIIIDEAHHAAVLTYTRIMNHFGVWNEDSHIYVWGCSATLRRSDALSLGKLFESVVYERGFLEMIQNGHLSDFKLQTLRTPLNLTKVTSQAGDYAIGELSKTVNTEFRNDIIVKTWLRVQDERVRLSTLVFAVNIAHVESLCREFTKFHIDARILHSKSDTRSEGRKLLVQQFREFKFPVLINCGILTEGTDVPNIDCIILARPTKSNILYQQMLGRGLRLHALKKDCLVIDVVDQIGKAELITTPSLLGLDPTFNAPKSTSFTELAELTNSLIKHDLAHKVMSVQEAQVAIQQNLEKDLVAGNDDDDDHSVMFQDVQHFLSDINIQSLLQDDAIELVHRGAAEDLVDQILIRGNEYGDNQIRFKSKFDWFILRTNVLTVTLPDMTNLVIDATERSKYKVYIHFIITKGGGARINIKRDVSAEISGDSMSMILTACDSWIHRQFPTNYYSCLKTTASKSGPISQSQISFLKRLGYLKAPVFLNDSRGKWGLDLDRRTKMLESMTKSQAGKAITRIMLRDKSAHMQQLHLLRNQKRESMQISNVRDRAKRNNFVLTTTTNNPEESLCINNPLNSS